MTRENLVQIFGVAITVASVAVLIIGILTLV